MGDITRANFNALTEGEAEFSLAARTLQRELNDLTTKLQSKLSQWDGDAQQAYWVFKGQWDGAAEHMRSIVNELGVAIGTSNLNYQDAEKNNTGIWTGA